MWIADISIYNKPRNEECIQYVSNAEVNQIQSRMCADDKTKVLTVI